MASSLSLQPVSGSFVSFVWAVLFCFLRPWAWLYQIFDPYFSTKQHGSGYSNDPIMASYKDYGFRAAVAKPFERKDLSDIIAAVL